MSIPEGWKLVPVEPTDEMLDAAARASMQHLIDCIRDPEQAKELGSEKSVRLTYGSRYRAMLAAAPPPPAQHSDDVAVDRFAATMKAKLAQKRAEGRGGWDDPEQCPVERLAELLHKHVSKGDPIDVANFAMMLWCRGGRTTPPAQDDEAMEVLRALVGALENAFISSWQSTAAWQEQLDSARALLTKRGTA